MSKVMIINILGMEILFRDGRKLEARELFLDLNILHKTKKNPVFE